MYIFTVVAGLVLLIASFNFVNLTTALSLQRAKEIGIRKAVVASRLQLIFQFLVDALLLTSLAFVLSVLLSLLFLPFFHQLAGKIIINHIFEDIAIIGLMGIISLTVGLLSGMYPAFFLSGFQPSVSLKGLFFSAANGAFLRKALVVGQFTISIILIIATLVFYMQVNHMQNDALGFKKEHQLVIDFQFDGRILKHQATIRQELLRLPGITEVSLSSTVPGRANHTFPTQMENAAQEMQDFQSDVYFIDHDYLAQYQIEVIAGRGFSSQILSDEKQAMLINETAVKKLGYLNPQDAVGKKFSQLNVDGRIIGVIKDFHFQSFEEHIQPLSLRVAPGFFTLMNLNISSENMQASIERVKEKWQELAPEVPMVYFFADEAFDALHKKEEQFEKLFICFSSLAIFISCLGLLAISIMSTSQSIKEIGIRKILGASVASLCLLLSKGDIKLILIALCIAIPIANYFGGEWLEHFAYRISISWWMFVLAGLMVLLISILTVASQTLKAARQNPVESLRDE